MPLIKTRDIITALGYEDAVLGHIKDGKKAGEIRDILLEDPIFLEKLHAAGRKHIYPTDIHNFLNRDLIAKTAIVENDVAGRAGAGLAVVAAKDRVLSLLATIGQWEAVTQRGLTILERELDKFEEKQGREVEDNPFPLHIFEAVRKATSTAMESARTLRNDHAFQGIVKAQTVNVGITADDLHETLFAVGRELGIEETVMLEAYTKVLVRRNRRKDFIDADIARKDAETAPYPESTTPAPWKEVGHPRRHEFIERVERSVGFIPPKAVEGT